MDAAQRPPPELKEARSPATPPERLADLAYHQDEPVRRAVAGNPNAPVETLIELAERFPEEVGQNPALPLIFLEHPGLLASMTAAGREALLARGPLPPELLSWYAGPEQPLEIRRAVAKNPHLPAASLARLAAPSNVLAVRVSAAANPSLPPEDLARLCRSKVELVRAAVASNPSLPAAERARLADDPDRAVRAAARASR